MFPQHAVSENVFSDLTLFMMRNQFVPAERFTTFDDKAESYNGWKFSFLDIVNELNDSKHEVHHHQYYEKYPVYLENRGPATNT